MYLYCNQRGQFVENSHSDKPLKFKSENQVKRWLVIYHSIDNNKEFLIKMRLEDLLRCFDWSIKHEK